MQLLEDRPATACKLIIIGICAGILRLGSRNHGQFTNIKAELNKWRVALDREGLL
jgi:hypothetical protein